MKPVRVRDLPNILNLPYPRPQLQCPDCGHSYSAHGPDYFMCDPDTIFTCPSCWEPLQLVTVHTATRAWAPERKRA